MKKNNALNYESIEVVITKEKTPILYHNKVECLMQSGLSRNEAENVADGCKVDLELYYEVGYGLFGVESEAVECTDIYSPYTKEQLEEEDAEEPNESLSTYYQAEVYEDDGTNVGWSIPNGLYSFQVFATREDCEDWLEENGYDLDDCVIREYHDDDIEDYEVI